MRLDEASEGLRAALAESRHQLGEEHFLRQGAYAQATTDAGEYAAWQVGDNVELRHTPALAYGDTTAGWDLTKEEPADAIWQAAGEWAE